MKKLFILLMCAGLLGCTSGKYWERIDGKPITRGDGFPFSYDFNECWYMSHWRSITCQRHFELHGYCWDSLLSLKEERAFQRCMKERGFQRDMKYLGYRKGWW